MADELGKINQEILRKMKLLSKHLDQNEGLDTAYTKGLKTQLENLNKRLEREKKLIPLRKKQAEHEKTIAKHSEQHAKLSEKAAKRQEKEDKNEQKYHLRAATLRGRLVNATSDFFKKKTDNLKETLKIDKIIAAKDFITGKKHKQKALEIEKQIAEAKLDELQKAEEEQKQGPVKAEKLVDNKESFTAKDDPNLEENKKQTAKLSDIAKSTKKMSSGGGLMGLLGGLALLVGAGGLIGFLMTGKTEFLFSVFKGFFKFGQIMAKSFVSLLKPFKLIFKPFTLLKKIIGGIGAGIKGLMSPIKTLKGIKQLKGLKNLSRAFRILKVTFKSIGKTIKGIKGGLGLFKGLGKIGKTAGKGFAKAGGKAGLKKIPVIGALMGLFFGIMRFKKGDILGGLLEVGSGLVSIVPGIGTVISLAIDAFLLFRDIKGVEASEETEAIQKGPTILTNIWGAVKTAVGAIGGFFSSLSDLPEKIANGISSFIGSDFVKSVQDKIRSVLSGAKDLFAPIGEFFSGLFDGFKDMIRNAIMNAATWPGPLGMIVRKTFNITKEDMASFDKEKEREKKEKIAKAKEIVAAKQPTTNDNLKLQKGAVVRLIPGAADGAIVTGPRKMMVGEGPVPEAIIPLNKIDDVYKEIGTPGTTGEVKAVEPNQIRDIREREDKSEEHMNNLKEFLSKDFIPELAKQIAGLINRETKKSADVPMSPY